MASSRSPLMSDINEYVGSSVETRELILRDMMGKESEQRAGSRGSADYSRPSSSSVGFFQQRPRLTNQFEDDEAFKRVLEVYLPTNVQQRISPDLSRFGELVLTKKILTWVADAEKNLPYLKTWDTLGKRRDELVTGEGWRSLQNLGIQEGIIAIAYENQQAEFSRVYQFLKYHIWSASSAYVICPSAMTDGAAALLKKHLSSSSNTAAPRSILSSAFKRLTSRDPNHAWTSGQWMTERKGGSDVSGTETLAVKASSPLQSQGVDGSPLGPYNISGFKWFSSATDAQMTVLLARTPDGGISTFYAPMRRTLPPTSSHAPAETELNGISIQRLKSKLGTRPVPTAELVLDDMRGYMLGAPGTGIKEIATVLNITRVHNSVTALGFWGRGLAITRAWARVRAVAGGKLLTEIPAHVTTLARLHVEYRAWMHLTYFTVLLLGISEQQGDLYSSSSANSALKHILPPRRQDASLLLRALTPVIKGQTAKASILGLGECMECLGGVGYLENEEMDLNVARLVRDAGVLSIWEGTTDVMGVDTLRAVKGRGGNDVLGALRRWIEHISSGRSDDLTRLLRGRWEKWERTIQSSSLDELQIDVRAHMAELGYIISGFLLVIDAERDADDVAKEVSTRWIVGAEGADTKNRIIWDKKIVFGDGNKTETSQGPWQPSPRL